MATILITGCSSGLGEASARLLAERGHRVFASCRRAADCARLATSEPRLETLPLDVTDPASIEAAVATVLDQAGALDVLLSNAGVSVPGVVEELPDASWRASMDANFFGPLALIRAVLPAMREQGQGRIVLLSSLSARVGLPGEGAYAASKAALDAAAESLQHEVERFGIRVTLVEPGACATPMQEKIAAGLAAEPGSPYARLLDWLARKAREGIGRGEPPAAIAALIADLVEMPEPPLRLPAGAQAEAVVAALRDMDDTERTAFIRAVNDTHWWSAGDEPPAD
ncbi:MAG: SDR family oxidoreductase [Gammaproteobacteria bacterium]|nr:MAG: SDR family oxidoreductase [Gammaproteobacteria bacterium]